MCVVLALVLPTGCAGLGPVIDGGCAWSRPIYVSAADALTEDTAAQVLAHNETGARICGWRRSQP